jgi:hypothetical protein
MQHLMAIGEPRPSSRTDAHEASICVAPALDVGELLTDRPT